MKTTTSLTSKVSSLFLSTISILIVMCLSESLLAQKPCSTDSLFFSEFLSDSSKMLLRQNMDNSTRLILNNASYSNSSNRLPATQDITIPVVFHILYDGSPPNGGFLSYNQILCQLDVLNQAFAGNISVAGLPTQNKNAHIKFCLAQNPLGPAQWTNPAEPGVMSYDIDANSGQVFALTFSPGHKTNSSILTSVTHPNATYFPSDKVLNIWTNWLSITGDLGVANFPNITNKNIWTGEFDGVIVDYQAISSNLGGSSCAFPNAFPNRNFGYTLVHEVGHYLDLYHTFQSTYYGVCTNSFCGGAGSIGSGCDACDIGGDRMCDIPPSDLPSSANLACDPKNGCTNAFDYPIHNFMSYSTQNCVSLFSDDQIDWMRATLENPTLNRYNLWQAQNLQDVGLACQPSNCLYANFSTSTSTICPNTPVQFINPVGQGFCANSWNWSFHGANISTSSVSNPTVSFITPGNYTISLTVSDGTNTATYQNEIIVEEITAELNSSQSTFTVCKNSKIAIPIKITNGVPPFNVTLSNGINHVLYSRDGNIVIEVGETNQILTITSITSSKSNCPVVSVGQVQINVFDCYCEQIENNDFEKGNVGFSSDLNSLTRTPIGFYFDQGDCKSYFIENPSTVSDMPAIYLQSLGNAMNILSPNSVALGCDVQVNTPFPLINIWKQNVKVETNSNYLLNFLVTSNLDQNLSSQNLQFRATLETSNGIVIWAGPIFTTKNNSVGSTTFNTAQFMSNSENYFWQQYLTSISTNGIIAGNYELKIQMVQNFGALFEYYLDEISFRKDARGTNFIHVSDNATLTVQNNTNWNNTYFLMGKNASIKVTNQSTLDIQQCTFDACTAMWNGIEVKENSALSMDASRIMQAKTAIYTNDNSLVNVKNSTFENNYVGLRINALNTNYLGEIKGSLFKYNASIGLLPPHNGKHPSTGIIVEDCAHWHIPDYNSSPNEFRELNAGIYSKNATLWVIGNQFDNIKNYDPTFTRQCFPTPCSTTNEQHGWAIYHTRDITNGDYKPNLTIVDEENNIQNSTNAIFANSLNFKAINNHIENTTFGIKSQNSWYSRIYINNNQLSNTQYGITFLKNVGAIQQAKSNEISVGSLPTCSPLLSRIACSFLGVNGENYGIKLQEITKMTSYSTQIANNIISNGRTGIHISNATKGTEVVGNEIYQDKGEQMTDVQNGIYANQSDHLLIAENNITGNNGLYDASTATLSNFRQRGIALQNTTHYTLRCNTIFKMGHGLHFQENCEAEADAIKGNHFNITQYGIVLRTLASNFGRINDPSKGVQGIGSDDMANGNQWAPYNNYRTINYSKPGNKFDCKLFFHPSFNLNFSQILHLSNIPTHEIYNTYCSNYYATFFSDCFDESLPWGLALPSGGENPDELIAANLLNLVSYPELSRYFLEKDLYQKLKEEPTLLSQSNLLADFYGIKSFENIGKIANIEEVLKEMTDTLLATDYGAVAAKREMAHTQMQALDISKAYDQHTKQVYELSYQLDKNGAAAIDSLDLAYIQYLAMQCPYTHGEGVNTARALLDMLTDEPLFYNDKTICNQAGVYKKENEEEDKDIDKFVAAEESILNTRINLSIYPNPTTGFFTISSTNPIDLSTLFITDLLGKKVFFSAEKKEGKIAIETKGLSKGIYILHLIDAQGRTTESKIVIE